MANLPQKYKFVYLSYFAINAILTISILIIQWLDLNVSKPEEWIESWIFFWGITMFLFLWGKSFVVSPKYGGKRCLSGRMTRLFVYFLLIIEFMTLYMSFYGHGSLLLPISVIMVIWTSVFLWSIFMGNRFIIK